MLGSIMAGPPLMVTIGSVLILGISLVQTIRSMHANRECLSLSPGGNLLMQLDNACWARMEIEKSLVSSWLVVVRVKVFPASKTQYLVYARDSMDRSSFRRLKVYLAGARLQQGAS